LIDALTGPRRSLDTLIGFAEEGDRLALSSLVLYEGLRRPRTKARTNRAGGPVSERAPCRFGPDAAALAARL